MKIFEKYSSLELLDSFLSELNKNNWVAKVGEGTTGSIKYSSGTSKPNTLYLYAILETTVKFSSSSYNILYSYNNKGWKNIDDKTLTIPIRGKVYLRGLDSTYDGNQFIITGKVKLGGDISVLHYKQTSFNLKNMFKSLTAIVSIDANLTDEEIPDHAYESMFEGCTNLPSMPNMSAIIFNDYSCKNMFKNCPLINKVSVMQYKSYKSTSFEDWLSGCSTTGSILLGANDDIPYPSSWSAIGDVIRITINLLDKNAVDPYVQLNYLTNGNTRNFYYRIDDGQWQYTNNLNTCKIPLSYGQILYLYGDNTPSSFRYGSTSTSYHPNITMYNSSGNRVRFNIAGNINSLIGLSYLKTTYLYTTYLFCSTFNSSGVYDASELKFPLLGCSDFCYANMFSLSSLKYPPKRIELINIPYYGCYYMFNSTLIETPPELAATSLSAYGCYYMFYYCQLLKESPILYAEYTNYSCYSYMFYYCTSLKLVTTYLSSLYDNSNTYYWLYGVASGGTIKLKKSTSNLTIGSYNTIPSGWTISYLD